VTAPKHGNAMIALAAFVRQRLAEMGDALAPLWQRPDAVGLSDREPGLAHARQQAMVIVSAAAPFAPTAYARARLLRQMHAAGLLTARETEQAERVIGVAR
jgi:hypothetical protein